MIRAGVPQSVAMRISGHRTISMFNRYDITSDEDRREALKRTQSYVAALPIERTVVAIGTGAIENRDKTRTKRAGGRPRRAANPLIFQAPRAGLEPATNRLTADRSTN